MAENIFQFYDGGKWCNESDTDRYNHVVTAFERFKNGDYDKYDLEWHIKSAMIGDIYFSEEVYKGIKNGQYWNGYQTSNRAYSGWITKVLNKNTLRSNGLIDEPLLKIREYLNKKVSGGDLRFEHMIPAKEYLDYLKCEFLKGRLTYSLFIKTRKMINVCIVTLAEDKLLSRCTMPNGWTFNNGSPDARYKIAGVKIHDWPHQSPSSKKP